MNRLTRVLYQRICIDSHATDQRTLDESGGAHLMENCDSEDRALALVTLKSASCHNVFQNFPRAAAVLVIGSSCRIEKQERRKKILVGSRCPRSEAVM